MALVAVAALVLPATAAHAGGGGTTVPTTGTTETTLDPTVCPDGPECVLFNIEPSSGPVGTVITLHAATGRCTANTGYGLYSADNPDAPIVGSGVLTDQGVSQWTGSITVPPGAPAGNYIVAQYTNDGETTPCVAPFTVTAGATAAVVAQPGLTG